MTDAAPFSAGDLVRLTDDARHTWRHARVTKGEPLTVAACRRARAPASGWWVVVILPDGRHCPALDAAYFVRRAP